MTIMKTKRPYTAPTFGIEKLDLRNGFMNEIVQSERKNAIDFESNSYDGDDFSWNSAIWQEEGSTQW